MLLYNGCFVNTFYTNCVWSVYLMRIRWCFFNFLCFCFVFTNTIHTISHITNNFIKNNSHTSPHTTTLIVSVLVKFLPQAQGCL